MENWHAYVQKMVEEIDQCIKQKVDDAMTLATLGEKWGYSPSYVSRKFKEISGMQFREYLRLRKLAFAVKDIRDSNESLLNIALDYGFSSHEAFTRAFKDAYGITPSEYRDNPVPLALRTII